MESKMAVSLLGLGTMGRGMALNLLHASFSLTVYNRTSAKTTELAAQGATVAESPAEAAASASVVLSMLSDDVASRAAWRGKDGALAAMQPGSIAVECSTVSPAWIAELAGAARERGLRFVEAPVTGSRLQAEGGQLMFLAGTDEETLHAVLPVLRCMSREVVHLGPIGCGAQLKLINNFLCGVQVASFAEALAWIERTELKRETALEFLKKGAPGSGIVKTMAERMTERKYDVNFLLRLMTKDLRYARAAAAQLGVQLTTGGPSEQLFEAAQQEGHGEKDMSAVVEMTRRGA
ncbi:MAG TPA: NAD(P)-dependent oxidoreductase [Acidobacteriaceae bacterium]|nr:NAD(P)-dependent oxidoreductase [Acidobacteriaceae bacterium]